MWPPFQRRCRVTGTLAKLRPLILSRRIPSPLGGVEVEGPVLWSRGGSGPKRPKTAQNGPKWPGKIENTDRTSSGSGPQFGPLHRCPTLLPDTKRPKVAQNGTEIKKLPFVGNGITPGPGAFAKQFVADYWPETHARLIMAPSSERSVKYVPGTQSL